MSIIKKQNLEKKEEEIKNNLFCIYLFFFPLYRYIFVGLCK